MFEQLRSVLDTRNLPALLQFADGSPVTAANFDARRSEIRSILQSEMFGFAPEAPAVFAENMNRTDELCAGEVTRRLFSLSMDGPNGRFSFPVRLFTPVGKTHVPVFVFIAFPEHIIQNDIPVSEILDRGYALAYFDHDDASFDGNDHHSGLWDLYPRDRRDSWGTIAMWAWAASRVTDYLCTLPEIDKDRIAVIGHSRLGKTALLAGALDGRFSLTISNDSGCGGAALFRGKGGEQMEQIQDRFPYWTCEHFLDYYGKVGSLPFDQHFLLAAVAPRHLYIASAANDAWADPDSEFLAAAAADPAWRILGYDGLIAPDALPGTGDVFAEGRIGYHRRAGNHFLTRKDWNLYMDYRDRHSV